MTRRYTSAAAELAGDLNDDWRNVAFDPTIARGYARIANIGNVEFGESSNDRAVIVVIPSFKFKCSVREAKKILRSLSKLVGSV